MLYFLLNTILTPFGKTCVTPGIPNRNPVKQFWLSLYRMQCNRRCRHGFYLRLEPVYPCGFRPKSPPKSWGKLRGYKGIREKRCPKKCREYLCIFWGGIESATARKWWSVLTSDTYLYLFLQRTGRASTMLFVPAE